MIRQTLYIEKYNWIVYAYYVVDGYYIEEIMEQLYSIGCRGDFLTVRQMCFRKRIIVPAPHRRKGG